MDEFNHQDEQFSDNEENVNITSDQESTNVDKKNAWENIINLLGLNININYPLKTIQLGLIEIYLQVTDKASRGRYTRNLKFKDDSTAKKLELEIFGPNSYSPYSQIQLYRGLLRIYRHYKYSNIINIVDIKTNKNKKDVMGFNYDNPRWVTLESVYI